MPSSNTGGYTKRVTATALVFFAYCVGNIVGPHAFLAKEAPVYETGCKLILACVLGEMVCTIALRALLIRRNKRRDAEGVAAPEGDADEQVLADLTDFEVCILLVSCGAVADGDRILAFDMFCSFCLWTGRSEERYLDASFLTRCLTFAIRPIAVG
jgi:hypothetical protein